MLHFPPGTWVTAGTWELLETKAVLDVFEMVWETPNLSLLPNQLQDALLQQSHPRTLLRYPRASPAAQPAALRVPNLPPLAPSHTHSY